MVLPGFLAAGRAGETLTAGGGRFLKLEAGKPIEIIPLTGVNPPDGEEADGKNCVISFMQYSLWLEEGQRPEGVSSPMFPSIGGPYDPGKLLGLDAKFRGMMLCVVKGDDQEQIWGFGKQVFKQLVEIEDALGESIRGKVIKISKTGTGMSTKYRVVNTGRSVPVSGSPETDLLEWIGPTTREEIVELLEKAEQWPPAGGDPMLAKKAVRPSVTPTAKPATTKPAAAPAAATPKPAVKKPVVVEEEPVVEEELGDEFEDFEDEVIEEEEILEEDLEVVDEE